MRISDWSSDVCSSDLRLQAIDAMQAALDAYGIRGINHNIAFLSSVMTNPRFRAGDLSTSFIAEVFPDGFQGMEVTEETREILIAVAAILQQRRAIRASSLTGRMDDIGRAVCRARGFKDV